MPDENLSSTLLDLTDELFVVSTLLEILQNGAVFGTEQLTLETCAAAAIKCQKLVTQLAATQVQGEDRGDAQDRLWRAV